MNVAAGVYVPLGMRGFELCLPLENDGFERINKDINGTPRGRTWRPVGVRLVHKDEGQTLEASDAPWFGSHALIFKPRVVKVLGAVLREYGELLPLDCKEAEVVIYNPTRVIDALDESSSTVVRFGSGRIMMIQEHMFRADLVKHVDVFKIPNLKVSPTFLSHRFVDRWREGTLGGLEFRQVWAPPN